MQTILYSAAGVAVLLTLVAVFQHQAGETQGAHRGNPRFHGNGKLDGHHQPSSGSFNSSDASVAHEGSTSQAAAIRTGQCNLSEPQHLILSEDYLDQELAGIDDAIESIRVFASYAGDASPDDYAKLHDLEKKRWAALKRSMGKERYLEYFYHESNAGRVVSKTLSPLLIPEKEQIEILAKATHEGEVDEIDQDVLFDQISGSSKFEAASTSGFEFMDTTQPDADVEPD